jgi:hypothetical protein
MLSSKNLFDACKNGSVEDANNFIQQVNTRDSNSRTPLMIGKVF